MFNHILVTLDGSAHSERVLAYIPDLAEAEQVRVTLLAVVTAEGQTGASDGGNEDAARTRTQRTYLEGHATGLREAGIAEVVVEVRTGPAAAMIAQTAIELGAELIVMGTQGVGAKQEDGIGSVAMEVLASTSCPVFMVRIARPAPPKTPAEEEWQSEGGGNVG